MRVKAVLAMSVVLGAVILNVISGVVLKTLADQDEISLALLAAGAGLALVLNGLRFLLWMYAHRRYPLSSTYPLTSLFFPIMLGVAYLYQEPVGVAQWLGAILITAGVLWLGLRMPS